MSNRKPRTGPGLPAKIAMTVFAAWMGSNLLTNVTAESDENTANIDEPTAAVEVVDNTVASGPVESECGSLRQGRNYEGRSTRTHSERQSRFEKWEQEKQACLSAQHADAAAVTSDTANKADLSSTSVGNTQSVQTLKQNL